MKALNLQTVGMYEQVKSQLRDAGEVMIMMSDGSSFELHLHNTSFDDDNRLIEIDAGDRTYWLPGGEVTYSWIHRSVN